MSDAVNENAVCRACGCPFEGDEPCGLCPRCLLRAALAADSGSHLHVRCPQCQIAIEIVDDPSVREVTCPSCDSRFSLIGDRAATVLSEHGGTVGRFELLERVGIGAFGSVWRALDPELDREVAVKLPRKEQLSSSEAEQFLREARAAGQLRHPGIVAVHEVGRDGDRIYIVSDFIRGVTLADSMTARRPTVRETSDLCRRVAEALEHAHRLGVIHRDLKPSNIMLDDAGLPHVMDFGLARRESAEVTITVEGRILGTPAYMSPEQARGDAHQADARSDVYSLGVILFELLTGEKPFRGTSQMLLHQVLQEEAPSPRRLNSSIPRDMETICLKCLEKAPERRYGSARELADELGRFLTGEPIRARPVSSLHRGWRWCRRNPVISGLTAAVAVSLLAGLATTFWQWRLAQENFERASESQADARKSQQEAQTALRQSESRLARVYVERGLQTIDTRPHAGLPWFIEAIRTEPDESPAREMHRLRAALMLYDLPELRGFWPDAADVQFSPDGAQVAVAVGHSVQVHRLEDRTELPPLQHEQPVAAITFSPDGDRIATVCGAEGQPSQCRIWNSQTGLPETPECDLTEREYGMREVPTLHFTPDGERLVLVYAGMYNRWHTKMVTRVLDARTLVQVSKTFAHHSDLDYPAGCFQLSPDRLRVLVSRGVPADRAGVSWDDPEFPDDMARPQQYDLMTAQPVHPPLDHELDFYGTPVYNQDGSRIATCQQGVVRIWNAADGTLEKEFPLSPGADDASVWFHPDRTSLIVIESAKAVWKELATGELKKEWVHEDKFFVEPAGRYVVHQDPNGQDYLAKLTTGDADETLVPDLYRVMFSPDGSRFLLNPAGYKEAGTWVSPPERIHRSADGRPLTPPWRFVPGGIEHPLSRDGRYYLSRADRSVWLWDLDQQRPLIEPFPQDRKSVIVDAAASRDGRRLAILTAAQELICVDAQTEAPVAPAIQVPVPQGPRTDASMPGRWESVTLNGRGDAVMLIGEYSHPTTDGKDREVTQIQVRSMETGQLLFDPLNFDDQWHSGVSDARFLRDDRRIVVWEDLYRSKGATPDTAESHFWTRLHVFDAATGARIREPQEYPQSVTVLGFTPDSSRCLVFRRGDSSSGNVGQPGSEPDFVQMLDTERWEAVTSRITPQSGIASNATLSPDGTRIVMGAAEIRDAVSGTLLVPALLTQNPERFVFQEDGQAFVAVLSHADNRQLRSAELRTFTIDGRPLASPMMNTRTGASLCAIHPGNQVIALAGEAVRFWDAGQGTALSMAIEFPWRDDRGASSASGGRQREEFFSPDGGRLYLEAGDEIFVVKWREIARSVPSDDVLSAWSGILSGQRIDSAGGAIPLTSEELQKAWQTLRQQAATDPTSH